MTRKMLLKSLNADGFSRVELAVKLLSEGVAVRLLATGFSMQPLIPNGSVLELEPCHLSDLRPGDVVLTAAFLDTERQTEFIIHRLLLIKTSSDGNVWLTTRGDDLLGADNRLEVASGTLIGRVVTVECNSRCYDYTRRYWRRLNRMLGWISAAQLARQSPANSGVTSWQTVVTRNFCTLFFRQLRQRGNRLANFF